MKLYYSGYRLVFIIIMLTGICLSALSLKAQSKNNDSTGFLRRSKTMAERWELKPEYDKGLFGVTPYRPVYITAGRRSDNPNKKPTSENPAYTLPFSVDYNNYESKFQFSFKTKIARRIFWGKGDMWVAFTQKAHWQLYNEKLSRPFRELNYEPELILNFPTNIKILGLNGRMLGIIFNHQSNGKIFPLSRSWNRVIIQAGFENKNWQFILRPWLRLKDKIDENPAIVDYIGAGEAIVVFNPGRHQLSTVMTHPLNFKHGGRGSIQLNWVFPVINSLRCQLQLSEGYGETLQDYNHRQTTIGISVALVDW